MSPIKRFFSLLELDKKDISYIYLYAIFSGLITLTLPLGVQAIIGLIVGGRISSSWILLVLVVTFGTALTGVLKIMQMSVTETLQQRIFTRSAFDLAYRIPKLKFESLYKEYAPELVNRFFDTLTLQKGLPKILMDFSTGILEIFFGLLLLSFYHPFFIFFSLLLILIIVIIFRLTGPRGLASSLVESKFKYKVASWLEELARSMGTFKLAGRSNLPLEKTDSLVSSYLDARKDHFRVLVIQYLSVVAFKVFITAGLLILGSILVIDNQINIGQFVAAEIILILIMASVEKLIITMETIYDVLTAVEKLGSLTDLPIEKEEGIEFEEIDRGGGISIALRDISYQFEDAEKQTLTKINLDIQAGERLCISGYNSSGKSTLLHILTGIYSNFTGSLTFNDVPFRNLDLVSLRAHIGVHLPQEDVFKGSFLENISIGHQNVSLQDIVRAVEMVGLKEFAERLPDGYHTQLLPNGKNLPRSVISKIILARCIASRPSFIALEDPFSFLEQKDREMISNLLVSKDQNWTLLVISNDPGIASKCDKVVLMENGKILAHGPFSEISKLSHFAKIFTTERFS